uniref:Uncharacterized protein n=1 Tax=Ixodes ricinus TaxID=34613 RepID=A0A6B0UM10_IXORI
MLRSRYCSLLNLLSTGWQSGVSPSNSGPFTSDMANLRTTTPRLSTSLRTPGFRYLLARSSLRQRLSSNARWDHRLHTRPQLASTGLGSHLKMSRIVSSESFMKRSFPASTSCLLRL